MDPDQKIRNMDLLFFNVSNPKKSSNPNGVVDLIVWHQRRILTVYIHNFFYQYIKSTLRTNNLQSVEDIHSVFRLVLCLATTGQFIRDFVPVLRKILEKKNDNIYNHQMLREICIKKFYVRHSLFWRDLIIEIWQLYLTMNLFQTLYTTCVRHEALTQRIENITRYKEFQTKTTVL